MNDGGAGDGSPAGEVDRDGHMSGDNNLEDYIVKDLESSRGAGIHRRRPGRALADRGPGYDKSRGDWQSTKLYHRPRACVAYAA